uniref:Uncharacterized protein n=1 Tax=Arundo donax TaxID=35708 RepID=A0A0A8Y0S6_ARUDO
MTNMHTQVTEKYIVGCWNLESRNQLSKLVVQLSCRSLNGTVRNWLTNKHTL